MISYAASGNLLFNHKGRKVKRKGHYHRELPPLLAQAFPPPVSHRPDNDQTPTG